MPKFLLLVTCGTRHWTLKIWLQRNSDTNTGKTSLFEIIYDAKAEVRTWELKTRMVGPAFCSIPRPSLMDRLISLPILPITYKTGGGRGAVIHYKDDMVGYLDTNMYFWIKMKLQLYRKIPNVPFLTLRNQLN